MGWNCLSISKLQRRSRWRLRKDNQFHPTLYWAWDYLSMPRLEWNHVSKRGPSHHRLRNWDHWNVNANNCQRLNHKQGHVPESRRKWPGMAEAALYPEAGLNKAVSIGTQFSWWQVSAGRGPVGLLIKAKVTAPISAWQTAALFNSLIGNFSDGTRTQLQMAGGYGGSSRSAHEPRGVSNHWQCNSTVCWIVDWANSNENITYLHYWSFLMESMGGRWIPKPKFRMSSHGQWYGTPHMSPCTGSRVNANYERIASWDGCQFRTSDPRISKTLFDPLWWLACSAMT